MHLALIPKFRETKPDRGDDVEIDPLSLIAFSTATSERVEWKDAPSLPLPRRMSFLATIERTLCDE